MKFGLICEGVTDYHVIKHIVQAYYPEAHFKPAQPTLDARELKQVQIDENGNVSDKFGGWFEVAKFLKSEDFEFEVTNTDFVIIQIDTDVCIEKGFDILDINLANIDHGNFYDQIKTKLIEWINSCGIPLNLRKAKRFKFYQAKRKKRSTIFDFYSNKVIFAISVHSLECWLLAYHGNKKCKIIGCDRELTETFRRKGGFFNTINKDVRDYIKHSSDFKNRKNHSVVIKKSESFKNFVEQLDAIST